MRAVKSPITSTAVCPSSWKRRRRRRHTPQPQVTDGAVGSTPYLTRSRPRRRSCSARPPGGVSAKPSSRRYAASASGLAVTSGGTGGSRYLIGGGLSSQALAADARDGRAQRDHTDGAGDGADRGGLQRRGAGAWPAPRVLAGRYGVATLTRPRPSRSAALVSLAEVTWVRLLTLWLARALSRPTSPDGLSRSDGWALATRASAAETCGAAIEVPWMAV